MRLLKDLMIDAGEIGYINEGVVRAQMMPFLSPSELSSVRLSMAETVVAGWDVRRILAEIVENPDLTPHTWRRRFEPDLVEKEVARIRDEIGAPIPFPGGTTEGKTFADSDDVRSAAEIHIGHVLALIVESVSTAHIPDEVVYASMITGLVPLGPQYLRSLCHVADIVILTALVALRIIDEML